MKFGVLISYPRVDHDIIELCLLDPRVPIHGPKTHPQAKSVVHLATVGMRKLLFAVIILRDEHVPNYPEKAKSYPLYAFSMDENHLPLRGTTCVISTRNLRIISPAIWYAQEF